MVTAKKAREATPRVEGSSREQRSKLIANMRAELDELASETFVMQMADEIRPISAFASEWQLEAKALTREAKRHGIAVRIGRALCVKRSALVAMVDTMVEANRAKAVATAPSADAVEDAYAKLVETQKRQRGKRVGAR